MGQSTLTPVGQRCGHVGHSTAPAPCCQAAHIGTVRLVSWPEAQQSHSLVANVQARCSMHARIMQFSAACPSNA